MTLENSYDVKSLTTPSATGGTITTVGDYRIHTFISSDTFVSNKSMSVEYLVVAGGGGGGRANAGQGGGGGAGGFRTGTIGVIAQSYPITVGNGGSTATPSNGENSVFSTITSIGGGKGGYYNGIAAGTGGSGGGGGQHNGTGAAGTPGQGTAGGNSAVAGLGYGGGGGGGASVAGSDSYGTSGREGGNGGAGTTSSISGTSITYAGGGGGASHGSATNGIPQGGIGGGGNGRYLTTPGANGTPNTGSGGGGGGENVSGGNGGSGIIIIRYLSSYDITATSMTVSPPSENPCRAGICTVEVSVTWTNNNSSLPSSFTPAITASSGTVTTQSSQNLNPGAPITLQFTVSNMTAGTCSICPNPN